MPSIRKIIRLYCCFHHNEILPLSMALLTKYTLTLCAICEAIVDKVHIPTMHVAGTYDYANVIHHRLYNK